MKCPICENYFDRDHIKFVRWYNGKEYIRICPDCFNKKPEAVQERTIHLF
jgi:hypothetical protein